MTTYADLAKQWKARDLRILKMFLELHTSCIKGVTAREAAEWLELPPGKASETITGIMLKELGYQRFRRHTENGREHRLFPADRQPEGWTL